MDDNNSNMTNHRENEFRLPNKVRETLYANGVALVWDPMEEENLVIKRAVDTESEQ